MGAGLRTLVHAFAGALALGFTLTRSSCSHRCSPLEWLLCRGELQAAEWLATVLPCERVAEVASAGALRRWWPLFAAWAEESWPRTRREPHEAERRLRDDMMALLDGGAPARADVALAPPSGGAPRSAHRFVLAARSERFRAMLSRFAESREGVVRLGMGSSAALSVLLV